MRHLIATATLCLALSACAVAPAAIPIAGSAVGAADVMFFHGCIGVGLANALPYNADDQYVCQPAR